MSDMTTEERNLSAARERYWMQLHLLAEAGENLVAGREDSLKALSLYKILQFSIDHAEVAVLRSCFVLGIHINSEIGGKTPLLLCIDTNSKELVSALVEYGVDVNLKTSIADSPLHYAVDQGKNQAVEGLLESAKNRILINMLGQDGLAPLHRAAKQNKKDMIRILAQHGADVNVKGDGGSTPLHIAAACNACSESASIPAI